jgi:hypothetical protein
MSRVQLTSTTGTETSQRSGSGSLLVRLNNPVACGLIAFLGWLAFALARWQVWAAGRIGLFVMAGHVYSGPANLPHVPSKGYDGQFYYRFALDPFNWHRTAYGITIDYNYRYTRLGYPLVAWIVSLGRHGVVPVVLVAVNLVFVAIMGWLGGKFARESGRHALWGLLFVAYFGLVISVGRDTAEPLADGCMLGGLLAYRHSRYILAAALIAYGVITNEPILVVAIAIALTRLYEMYRRRAPSHGGAARPTIPPRARPGLQDLVWVLPGAAYVVLQGIEHVVVKGRAGGFADIRQNFAAPFWAMIPAIYEDFRRLSFTHLGIYDYNVIEVLVLLAFVVAGLLVLRATTAPVHERVAFVGFVLVEMVLASGQFWGSVFGDGRTYIDAYLLAVIMLLATPVTAKAAPAAVADGARKAWVTAANRVFAANRVVTNKRLGWLTAAAVAVLIVVARRHILFQ